MIHEIFIIEEGGKCLLHCSNSEKIRIEEGLFSSFTTAIRIFANELDETVHTVELKEYKLIFFALDELMLIAVSDKTDSKINVRRKLALAANEFIRQFKDVIGTDPVNIAGFNGFDEKIAAILFDNSEDGECFS
jgi:hypothetical protein